MDVLYVLVLALATALASPVSNERVIGGQTAPKGYYLYQVSLRLNDWHFCGGSIISPNWVLTAAHCLATINPSTIEVVAGTHYLNSGGIRYQVAHGIIHQGYSPITLLNDIALIMVTDPIKFDFQVQPIKLASIKMPPGWWCIFSGWGAVSYPQETVPNQLQHIQLMTITNDQCKAKLSTLPFPIEDTHACTMNGPGQGLCKGDSGGPLACGDEQFGVISWVVYCATGAPDVFTAVYSYRNWIMSIAGV